MIKEKVFSNIILRRITKKELFNLNFQLRIVFLINYYISFKRNVSFFIITNTSIGNQLIVFI